MYKNKSRGITLTSLVITIILLLILAGITISQLTQNGLFTKAKQATEEYKKSQIKEELQIAINSIQIELLQEDKEISIENIVIKLRENKNNYLSENIEYIDNDGKNGKYKGYNFYIDAKFEVILKNKSLLDDNEDIELNENYIILNGDTYIDSEVQEEQLISNDNQEFTIATSVYINKDMQINSTRMTILGNHQDNNGFTWQFNDTKLSIFSNGKSILVDYEPYYEKWTKIVMTYKQGTMKVYIDNVLIGTENIVSFIPYHNILIGTGYLGENRTMKGAIKSVKIWGKELSQEDINNINYDEKNTNIQKNSIIKEINFNNNEQTLSTIVGTNYQLVPKERKIDYEIKLIGGNLLDINLPESTILENSEFTIAAKVKINSNEQKSITSMGILGNHTAKSGITWQFLDRTSTLQMGVGTQGQAVDIDYTEYYDKNVDIVMTYKDKVINAYINNKKIATQENIDMVPNGNLYIGSSFGDVSRGMSGYLPYVKIWNKALTEEQIKTLKIDTNTNIETQNILKELDLTRIENYREYGTLSTNNYKMIMIGK